MICSTKYSSISILRASKVPVCCYNIIYFILGSLIENETTDWNIFDLIRQSFHEFVYSCSYKHKYAN